MTEGWTLKVSSVYTDELTTHASKKKKRNQHFFLYVLHRQSYSTQLNITATCGLHLLKKKTKS